MIIIHDLVEAYKTDIPTFDTINNLEAQRAKVANALDKLEAQFNTMTQVLKHGYQSKWKCYLC